MRIFLASVLATLIFCPYIRKLTVILLNDFFGSIILFNYFILSVSLKPIKEVAIMFFSTFNLHINFFYTKIWILLKFTEVDIIVLLFFLCEYYYDCFVDFVSNFFNDFWSFFISFFVQVIEINFINSFIKSLFRCFGKYYKFIWFLLFITIFLIVELQKNFFFLKKKYIISTFTSKLNVIVNSITFSFNLNKKAEPKLYNQQLDLVLNNGSTNANIH
jgi:hypothetical protein